MRKEHWTKLFPLIVDASTRLFAACGVTLEPDQGKPSDDADLRDWLCELSNQLLGRLKFQLLHYGISFELSTPSCLLGRDLRVEGEDLVFRAGQARVYVRVEMECSGARFMSTPPQDGAGHAQEGELLFFE